MEDYILDAINYDGFLTDIYDFCPYFKGRGNMVEYYLDGLKGKHLNILELGTATGSITIPLVASGCSVDTVDYSRDMQNFARKKAENYGHHVLNKINFILNDVCCFIPAKTYDAVIIPDSLLTVLPKDKDREKVLTMCYNALKDGGLLMFDVFKPAEKIIQKQMYQEASRFRDANRNVYIVTVSHRISQCNHLHTCLYDYRKWPNIKDEGISIKITYKYLYMVEVEQLLTQIGFCNIGVKEIFDGHINLVTAYKLPKNIND